MFFRILLAFFFGYLIFKGIRFFRTVYTAVNKSRRPENVRETKAPAGRINKEDIIEAQFEEIEVNKNTSDSE